MTDKLKPVAYATKSFLESITGLGDIVTFKNDSDDLQKCEKIGLYDQQQVDQLQAQIAELQAKVGGISGVDLKDGWISWDGMDMSRFTEQKTAPLYLLQPCAAMWQQNTAMKCRIWRLHEI